jgi:uncharacterized protein
LKRISRPLLRRLIVEATEQAPGHIDFLWHGGEPLLAGRELFEFGVAVQNEFASTCDIHNAVQTNGLLIDNAWLDFFEANRFSIGISLDGPAFLHDPMRVDAAGLGTHQAVAAVTNQLVSRNIEFGIICVVGTRHAGHAAAILRHFHDLGVRHADFHQSVGMAGGETDIPPKQFSDFAIDLFEEWLNVGDADLRINLFDDFFRGWIGPGCRTCYFAGACSSIIAIEANGDVLPCTRPFGESQLLGNITESSLAEVSNGSAMARFREQDANAIARSNNCEWGHLCKSGCPQHRRAPGYIEGEAVVEGINPFCRCQSGIEGGHAAIWDHIARRTRTLFGLDETSLSETVHA